MNPVTPVYRGRFAPTPSGPLHLGSLLTALASWLAARQAGGRWLLRIDDLDRPRCVAGAEDTIRRQLEAHGLVWDDRPVRQTEHEAEYRAALQTLDRQGQLYTCACTRASLAETSRPGPDGPVYAGICRTLALEATAASALRLKTAGGVLQWQDGIQGRVQRTLPSEAGDFVLRRADGQIGYHLACALDEVRMGITEVVRGADLLGATVHQLLLLQALALPAPAYTHVPVLLAPDGRKLSKQNRAEPLQTDPAAVGRQLFSCLQALRLEPPAALTRAAVAEQLHWALSRWDATRLAGITAVAAADRALPL